MLAMALPTRLILHLLCARLGAAVSSSAMIGIPALECVRAQCVYVCVRVASRIGIGS